ncbi:hypothetical protein B0H15DRAFT_813313 [Mycena belliarum]|uniref:Uncharacterized protein n=1 Tax=Mycena belliarum TaxID=1033014 RepID=A0AAD6UK91_9AGAR|nr:hypothetical protein B0H15DRAFT_813313 [Mycena belliae]
MAASATWQASRTLPAQPTVFSSDPQLIAPRITQSPSCCEQNELLIEISTTLLVPDYARYYNTPILAFQPNYLALPDGSLATAALLNDLTRSYLSLMVTAMLVTVFLRNIIVSFDYIRRANMKRKTLFFLLLSSQLLSIGLVPLLVSYFSSHLDCTAVMTIASATTGVSLTLLMSGVLGLKAYRCLDSSRVVLLALVTFFVASSTFLVLQVASIRGLRRLSGSCCTVSHDPRFIRIYVLIQLAHSFFICCCFFHAVWKSRASPAARGRLSVRVSLDDFPNAKFDKPSRAWWQHLLGLNGTVSSHPDLDVSSGAADIASDMREKKPPESEVNNYSPHDVSDPILEQPSTHRVATREADAPYRRLSSFSRLIPRMELFNKVMKDELCYTTTITATTVILALLLVFGVNFDNGLDMTGWVAANWAIISVLVIHSFGRVVRRHEKDALFQHPSSWWPERDMIHRSPYSRRAFPRPRQGSCAPEADPFSDSRGLRESMTSWNSGFSDSPTSPIPVASTRDRRLSLPSPFADISSSNRNTLFDSIPPHGPDRTFVSPSGARLSSSFSD